jgi:hypothetical protein
VAEKLGRRWIGIDCGKLAIYLTTEEIARIPPATVFGGSAARIERKMNSLSNSVIAERPSCETTNSTNQ